MSIRSVHAAVAVTDLAEAKDFYALLLGRPADLEPMPSLAQWDVTVGGGVQVVELPERAGAGMLTLLVPDFDATLAELRSRGIETGEVVDGVLSRLVQLTDPAGNTVTLAEVDPG